MSDEIRYPSVRQVERLYDQIIAMTGGEHGYISKANLEYLLDAVKDIGERLERRRALAKKAAYLLYNIIVLHPFVNGNKRTGYDLVRLFLRLNGCEIHASQKDTYRFLIEVASGNVSAREVDKWVAINLTEISAE